MTSRWPARTFAGLGGAACVSSVMACGLLYGFDRYDTDIAPTHDAGLAGEAEGPADFDLIVTDAFRVEPGSSALLAVEVKRRGASSERIDIATSEPLPVGVERAVSATLDADVSSATLSIAVRLDAPITTQTLHLTARSASRVHTKDLALTSRGAPCAADHSFAPNGTGVLRFPPDGTNVQPIGLSVVASLITVALSPSMGLVRLDATGKTVWGSGTDFGALGIAVDPTGGVVVASPDRLTRREPNGLLDLTYGTAGDGAVRPPCTPVAIAQRLLETSIVCVIGKARQPTLVRYDGAGLELTSDSVDFGVSHEVVINGAYVITSPSAPALAGGVVACGHSIEGTLGPATSAAFVRWLPSGEHDVGFGLGGRVVLGTGTDAFACAADEAGVVSLATYDGHLSLVALTAGGDLQSTFGHGGAEPLRAGATMLADSARMVLDTGAIVTVVTAGGASFVVRHLRDGQLDPTFGQGGTCALGPLSLANVASIALAPDGKLYVLSTDGVQALLARIWL